MPTPAEVTALVSAIGPETMERFFRAKVTGAGFEPCRTADGFFRIDLSDARDPLNPAARPLRQFLDVTSDDTVQVVGRFKTAKGGSPILVYSVPLKGSITSRASRRRQADFARCLLKLSKENLSQYRPDWNDTCSTAVFFFCDEKKNFRMSLIESQERQFRRYTFFVEHDATGEKNRTFRYRMTNSSPEKAARGELVKWNDYQDIKDAFSVEALTKEFYRNLFDWYNRACQDKSIAFPNNVETDTDDQDRKPEHLIRLITRMMFVWFIKQKNLVPETLFDKAALKRVLKSFDPMKGDAYYRAILQNLFFATLNSEITERAFANDGTRDENKEHFDIKTLYRYRDEYAIPETAILALFRSIPFLNGGLFECLDRGKNYFDGFSRNPKQVVHISNAYFFDESEKTLGIIPLLSRYNFTVDENAPGDEDVALDPELLGKVFENLLGAYNPETQVAARNATGSFYTPREIVNYMVDESLVAHLLTMLEDGSHGDADARREKHEKIIREIFTDGVRPADDRLCAKLDRALVSAKILDPACGSGAFPMGMLLRMVELLRILRNTPESDTLYGLKLELIENCIYGGDIQCIAVQISKLRFFISLVCEQTPTSDPITNYGINPLPNLETKFVTADSLIGLAQSGNALPMRDVEVLKRELWDVRHEHFGARSYRAKRELRKKDKILREKLAKALEHGGGFDTESAALMVEWDPYDQNTSTPFSDPAWMFNVRDGFDIVIGNPPYIKEYTNRKAFLRVKGTSYYMGKMDLWYYFACKMIDILAEKGLLCFIATNNWVTNAGAAKLRTKVIDETQILKIMDFGAFMIFENADIQTMIMLLKKDSLVDGYTFDYRRLDKSCAGIEDALALLRRDTSLAATYLMPEIRRSNERTGTLGFSGGVVRGILNKIEVKGCFRLTEKEVANGIHPHYDFIDKKHATLSHGKFKAGEGIFGLSARERDGLRLSRDELSLLRPYYTSAQVGRYLTEQKNTLWIIYTDSSFRNRHAMDAYPNLKRHLDRFQDIITSHNKPYGLHRSRDERFFKGEKIIALRKCLGRPLFSFSDSDCYVSATFYVIKTDRLNCKFLVGLLNSRLVAFWLRHRGKMQGDNYQLDKEPLLGIPIVAPERGCPIACSIEHTVDLIMATKRASPTADIRQLEKQIDEKVYQLYGIIDQEEQTMIEASSAVFEKVKKGASTATTDKTTEAFALAAVPPAEPAPTRRGRKPKQEEGLDL